MRWTWRKTRRSRCAKKLWQRGAICYPCGCKKMWVFFCNVLVWNVYENSYSWYLLFIMPPTAQTDRGQSAAVCGAARRTWSGWWREVSRVVITACSAHQQLCQVRFVAIHRYVDLFMSCIWLYIIHLYPFCAFVLAGLESLVRLAWMRCCESWHTAPESKRFALYAESSFMCDICTKT